MRRVLLVALFMVYATAGASAGIVARIDISSQVMTVSQEIGAMALERRPAEEIRDVAVRQGMRRLPDDGLDKVKQGRTSIAEIARVIGSN